MPNRIIIGVDPGASGGLAWVSPDNDYHTESMPITEWDILERICLAGTGKNLDRFAYIEQVGGYIADDHDKPGMGSSMFNFGVSYGRLRMALIAAGIPFESVHARTWQKVVGVGGYKGETKTEHKNRMKGKAQQLFPNAHVTLATADALLIAYYGTIMERKGK